VRRWRADASAVTEIVQSPQSRSAVTVLASPEFEQVYRDGVAYVAHSLRRLGARPADLEDLTHDVFVVVHRRLATFDAARPIRPWLFGIAYRVLLDFRRLARHRSEVSPSSEPADPRTPEDSAVRVQQREILSRVLAELDPERRAIFVMHEVDGHAMPEIAAALDLPLNTAYSRLRLARRDIAEAARRLRAIGGSP
jgi:RNA polymerase sigma-70 factor, ECF subfamily